MIPAAGTLQCPRSSPTAAPSEVGDAPADQAEEKQLQRSLWLPMESSDQRVGKGEVKTVGINPCSESVFLRFLSPSFPLNL